MQHLLYLLALSGAAVQLARGAVILKRADEGYTETLSDATIELVKQRLAESAHGSWENGTRAQALLEYDYPMLSVFYNPAIPIVPGYIPTESNTIAQYTIANKPADSLMFVQDLSAGDPASLGVSILLANHTLDVNYTSAVNQQNDYLLRVAPRTEDGALSHRVRDVQLWSDFLAMVPPYLAYYGALTKNDGYLQAAYDQCRLYRQYLQNGTALFRHILLPGDVAEDLGYWATGNAWAAWGMSRVLVTMMHTQTYSDQMESQKQDLQGWIVETLKASYASIDSNTGLLPNYLGEQSFPEASSTALMASVSYRMAQLGLDTSTLADADMARHAVFALVDNTTGWLGSVVDPLDWTSQGQESSEGQSFTLLLAAAYRDYNNATVQTAPPNGGGGGGGGGGSSAAGHSRDMHGIVIVLLAAAAATCISLV